MIIIGGRPKGRYIEQHDIFFGIASELHDLSPEVDAFWPEIAGKWHIDSWREVNYVEGYAVTVALKNDITTDDTQNRLYFVNLGGYKENDMEEYHYKLLAVGPDKGAAVTKAKQTAFYKHTGFKGAASHIDDKYSIDVDDLYELKDILPAAMKEQYRLVITPSPSQIEDELHIGYLKPRFDVKA